MIVTMKKVTLLSTKTQVDETLEELRALGLMHINVVKNTGN